MRLRLLPIGIFAAVTLTLGVQPANAVYVTADFTLRGLDFGSSDPVPPPFLIATPGPTTGRLTYDTALGVPRTVDPENLSMTYLFTSGASLAITFGGATYSSTASPANPFRIAVGAQPFNNFFIAGPVGFPADGVPAEAADPSNALPAFPFLDLLNGNGSFTNAALPTASFPNTFIDPIASLRSIARTPDQGSVYFLRFLLTSDVTITAVPEPSTLAILALPAAMVLLGRRFGARASARRSLARCLPTGPTPLDETCRLEADYTRANPRKR
jgi:hypothetical protein